MSRLGDILGQFSGFARQATRKGKGATGSVRGVVRLSKEVVAHSFVSDLLGL